MYAEKIIPPPPSYTRYLLELFKNYFYDLIYVKVICLTINHNKALIHDIIIFFTFHLIFLHGCLNTFICICVVLTGSDNINTYI